MNRLILLFCGILLGCSQFATAQNKKPLLMPNKKNLFQRVLTVPGAKLYPISNPLQANAIQLPPFSVYYVYDRVTDADEHNWLQVGLDRVGNLSGWISVDKTLSWSQGLTLTFRKPIEKDRVLLFRNKSSILEIAENYDVKRYRQLYQAASQGKLLKGSPVVAIQPNIDIDIRKDFYLLPIHDYEEVYLRNHTARLLQVSSIPLKPTAASKNHQANAEPDAYTAGIVFAIDSTHSMQPYIERTREAVRNIYHRLEEVSLLGSVHFGLVAFRDNPTGAPGIQYLTRRYVSLMQGQDSGMFMDRINGLQAAKVSSQDFIEDSYAGVYRALDDMDWSPHAARYIVLITDAGARTADDPLATTHLDATSLNRLAQEKNVAIFVLHLLTPSTLANHHAAAKQYRELSYYPGIGSLYYGVPTGDLFEFGKVLDSLSKQITSQVGQTKIDNQPKSATPATTPELANLQSKVAKLGHALRIRYLQDTQTNQVPDVFKAWLLDKSFQHPERTALDVRVLLTRDELSDLHDILKQVLDVAEQGMMSPRHFLNELKSLAVTIARDPKRLGATTAITAGQGNSLADMGFMQEYIEDLPYTGEIMNLALEDWQSWSAKQQNSFLQKLSEKITYYKNLHDHIDLWVSLDGGAIDGSAVFPIPLSMLP